MTSGSVRPVRRTKASAARSTSTSRQVSHGTSEKSGVRSRYTCSGIKCSRARSHAPFQLHASALHQSTTYRGRQPPHAADGVAPARYPNRRRVATRSLSTGPACHSPLEGLARVALAAVDGSNARDLWIGLRGGGAADTGRPRWRRRWTRSGLLRGDFDAGGVVQQCDAAWCSISTRVLKERQVPGPAIGRRCRSVNRGDGIDRTNARRACRRFQTLRKPSSGWLT